MTDTQKDMENNEISLIDLLAVIWRRKILIIGITVCAMVGSFLYAFIGKKLPPEKSFMPDVYTSTAFMKIRSAQNKSSLLDRVGASSLGSLIGNLSSTGDTTKGLVFYISGSDAFLDAIVDEFKIIEKYAITRYPKFTSRKIIRNALKVKVDEKTNVFSLSFTHIDPRFAQAVVLFAVQYYEKRFSEMGLDSNLHEKENLEKAMVQSLNEIKRLEQKAVQWERSVADFSSTQNIVLEAEQIKREILVQEKVYGQLKVQYELLKVTIASEVPLFQVLDMPEISEKKSGPSRGLFCIIMSAVGLFLAVFLAFFLNAIENIKTDVSVRVKFKKEQ